VTTLPKRRIRWRATTADGIAHAFRGSLAAVCGARWQEEKWDWPMRSRCPECLAHEAEVEREPIAS
jgi:hypothetical protein